MDGVFDMMHYGHVNAFRQGRSLGDYLIVGVNSTTSITACKGAPLMSDDERCALVASCRFVDQVVPDVPYIMDEAYILSILEGYQVDLVVHGDDECLVDGKDVYAAAKRLGRFRTVPRTEGVSTTDIVGRMLGQPAAPTTLDFHGVRPSGRVVYCVASFDLFHHGHVEFLKSARQRGDSLLVGVLADDANIMTAQERRLSVLGCRYVDDALLDAPRTVTDDFLDAFGVRKVVASCESVVDYSAPRRRGIFEEDISNPDAVTVDIVARVARRSDALLARYVAKSRHCDNAARS